MSEYVKFPRGERFGEFVLIKTIIYEKTYKSNARSAIVFRFLLSQKEPGVYGGGAPVTLREAQLLRAEHGKH